MDLNSSGTQIPDQIHDLIHNWFIRFKSLWLADSVNASVVVPISHFGILSNQWGFSWCVTVKLDSMQTINDAYKIAVVFQSLFSTIQSEFLCWNMLKWGLKLDIFTIPNSLFFDPIEINCQCNHWKCSNGHHFFQCLCWIAKYISHLPFSGENGSLAIFDGIFLCNAGLKESTNDTRGQNIWVFMLVNIKKDVGWSFIGTAISASLNRSNLTLLDQRFSIDLSHVALSCQ